ncbi:hypothetical protein SNE510_73080 [Streptomyces sp. NE5-10]|nr:hypothetical protein SNE510_73080 [Streptomyces sp. NE5-10]
MQGKNLTGCAFPLAMFGNGFCRVTVEDEDGNRAWSNPIHLAPAAATGTR